MIAIWIAVVGLSFLPAAPAIGAPAVCLAVTLFIVALRRRRWRLSFVTDTHALNILARDLTDKAQAELVAAAKARSPRIFAREKGAKGVDFLVTFPFSQLLLLLKSDDALRAEAIAESATALDTETMAAFVSARRLLALWTGGLCALLPLAWALAGGLTFGPFTSLGVYVLSTVAGWIVSTRLVRGYVRFLGLQLQQP